MEFKGTKGLLERKYVSNICIGIGTIGDYCQITANSVLPDSDDDYEEQKEEIEANMLIYSKAPEMLEMLQELVRSADDMFNNGEPSETYYQLINKAVKLIKEAITLEV